LAAKKGGGIKSALQTKKPLISLKVLRWKMVLHKMSRALGLYTHTWMAELTEKFETINEIFRTFLQVLEYWPTRRHRSGDEGTTSLSILSELDEILAEDILMVALEFLHEITLYEKSVMNPINFQ
jgi:hypothetical protein